MNPLPPELASRFPAYSKDDLVTITPEVYLDKEPDGGNHLIALCRDLNLDMSMVSRQTGTNADSPKVLEVFYYSTRNPEAANPQYEFQLTDKDIPGLSHLVDDQEFWTTTLAKYGKLFASVTRAQLDGNPENINQVVFADILEKRNSRQE